MTSQITLLLVLITFSCKEHEISGRETILSSCSRKFLLWQKRITIIPIIVGSLECVKSNLDKAQKDLSIEAECLSYTLQKTAVLASV